ncbi:HlyD family type I secretion periplasmic adaptor subunit [Enterovibrio norvegicus]|uniref:HlyD family type I secretion periplasmic adaptor subunit n=1 Tax=Enterovibrio norvegicus TaxID=188144 RepID=UPI003553E2F6
MLKENLKVSFDALSKIGVVLILGLFLTLIALSSLVAINGAVVAIGSIGVSGKPKVIQHLDGGVVKDILIEDGQYVAADDVLAILDSSLLDANLEIYRARLSSALSSKDRLLAEQANLKAVLFSKKSELLDDFDIELDLKGQRDLFHARKELNEGKNSRIREKINQFQHQIRGVSGKISALLQQESLIKQEVTSLSILEDKGLIAENQLLNVKRGLAEVHGDLAERRAEISRIRNSINDAEIELLQEDRMRTEEIVSSLKEANSTIHELTQQIISTKNKLKRIEIVSPIDGYVHELAISTIGGVIKPGETMLQIVPDNTKKEVIVRVDPMSIDQVHIDQLVKVRFSSFNQNVVPELEGKIENISANTSIDEASGQSYYSVRVQVPNEELVKLNGLDLISGMPVEAYIQTSKRTVIGYFTKPLTSHVLRAFNED